VTAKHGVIAVAGALAQRPGRGGHAWVFLQYLLGLRRLGWDVVFIDRVDPGMSADPAYVDRVMRDFGLADDYAVLGASGIGRQDLVRRLKGAEVLLNFMGYLQDEELLALFDRRVFVDLDPGFTQMWQALGLAEMLAGHEVFVTVGANIGRPDCTIPPCGVEWITTLPPVVLDWWRWSDDDAESITGVGAWRGSYGIVRYDDVDYGLRVHEFRRYADVPARLAALRFEYALEIDAAEGRDIDLLTAGGWRLSDPCSVAGTPQLYRDFVSGSKAELMIAKSMYVKSRSGWFSDRSACYLASGRPVIAQDTGRAETHRAGLLTFTTADQAVDAVEQVIRDYPLHRRAAREIAEAELDSDLVLGRLVEEVLAA
jgi:hypothetical protein